MESSATAAAAAGIGAHVFCWTEAVVHLCELLASGGWCRSLAGCVQNLQCKSSTIIVLQSSAASADEVQAAEQI